jgi:hypothetical protein
MAPKLSDGCPLISNRLVKQDRTGPTDAHSVAKPADHRPRDCSTCTTERSRQSAEEEEAFSQQIIGYDGALNNRTREPRALLEPQALEAAPDGIDEAETRGLVCERRVDCVVMHVICYIHKDLVRLGTDDGRSTRRGRDRDDGSFCGRRWVGRQTWGVNLML